MKPWYESYLPLPPGIHYFEFNGKSSDFNIKTYHSCPPISLSAGDATNFLYELEGDFNDDMMDHFNGLFKRVIRKGKEEFDIATRDRMAYLNDNGINLKFVRPFNQTTAQNLVMCGGLEMPDIVGEMLKKFYHKNLGSRVSILDCIDDLAETDVVGYGFSNLHDLYYGKVATLLYSMFTGLKMGKPWNGRAEVNGGYVVVKSDGDVVAYHSTVTDEFKDFLVHKLHMEAPSHKRHKDMVIEKVDGKYYLKLALQFRFSMKK